MAKLCGGLAQEPELVCHDLKTWESLFAFTGRVRLAPEFNSRAVSSADASACPDGFCKLALILAPFFSSIRQAGV